MIGQERLKEQIDAIIDNFPRFSIIQGARGSCKFTVAKEIANRILDENGALLVVGKGIDDVRGAIRDAYRLKNTTVFIMTNVDTMSVPAQNALLKVTEEPPYNAYFVLTANNVDNLLPTIRSRASVFNMDPYKPSELIEYAGEQSDEVKEIISVICDTPGDVDILLEMGAVEFYEYVEKVFDNIDTVSESNAFKISDKIALKQDSSGYDLILFLKAFMSICVRKLCELRKIGEDGTKLRSVVIITSNALSELRVASINKVMLFDCWLMNVRDTLEE